MCDQYDNRGCEVVDELHLEITNLEMTIAEMKLDIVEDLKRVVKIGGIGEGNWISPGQIEIITHKWETK